MFPECDCLSGYSAAYNVGLAIFGGLTPMIATGLIACSGVAAVPGYYLVTLTLLAIIAFALTPDRSRAALR